MNPSDPNFIQNLIASEILEEAKEEDMIETAILAATLLIVNNQDVTSDEYDTDCEYEEVEEDYEYEEPQVSAPLPRKRGHSELRGETPCPVPQGPQHKRIRLANMPPAVNEGSTSYDSTTNSPSIQPRPNPAINIFNPSVRLPSVRPPNFSPNQTVLPFWLPERVIACIPNTAPFQELITRACVDVVYRFRGKTSEKNLAIMATRMWRDPREARMYESLSEKDKQICFEKWVTEVKLGQWTPPPLEPQYRGIMGEPQVVLASTSTTRLKADALKQIDASSKGKLDDRVRLWLSNVRPL